MPALVAYFDLGSISFPRLTVVVIPRTALPGSEGVPENASHDQTDECDDGWFHQFWSSFL